MKKTIWDYLRNALYNMLMFLFVAGCLFAFMLIVYCFAANLYHAGKERSVCEEYCNPNGVVVCTTKNIKFWHPSYVDAVVLCGEIKENRVIKE